MAAYRFNSGSGPTTWTQRPSSESYANQNWNVTPLVLGTAAIGAGFVTVGSNKNIWNYYTQGLRTLEEYSPAGIFKTFHLSTFTSQFQKRKYSPEVDFFSPKNFTNDFNQLDYFTNLIGGDSTRKKLLQQGVSFRNNKLFWGQSNEVALNYASRLSTVKSGIGRLQSAYSASLGNTFTNHEQIIGGKNIFQHVGRQMGMLGTEGVGRFNRLLEAPFEMEPFKTVFSKAREIFPGLKLSVEHGSGSQMLGRLAVKYGAKLGIGILAYQTADWAIRESSLFNKTALDQGLTYGIATLGISANKAISKVSELTGLHAYREKQEEIAPGSTSLQKLSAFPLMGASAGALISYTAKIQHMAKLQINEGKTASEARVIAQEHLENFIGTSKSAKHLRNIMSPSGFYARDDKIGKIFRSIAKQEGDDLSFKFIGKLGPTKLASLIGAGIGLAAIAPFLPGALIPSTRPDELEAIYSGKQEVGIRKGRWWEFGRSPYEGNRIMYYRPHWYAKMAMRAREASIWGEAAHSASPISRWFQQEFTYNLEEQHYKDRPYPITSLPFEDVPLIGPLLANTIGRLIKPPRLMHEEEWQNRGATKAPFLKFGQSTATELGELSPPQPISPYDPRGTIGEQAYRITEMIGLPGYAATSLKEAITGSQDLFDQYSQLESARRMFGAERAYWDAEIGGGLGTTEALRRLIPHRRRQIELYNPIRNTMPDWLPGAGERGPDLKHGDPYAKVQEGELRLPGAGYEERYKELKGLNPEDYPLIHKYRILADVAGYTDQFKNIAAITTAKRKQGWSDYEEAIYQQTQQQIKEKKDSLETFRDYKYLSKTGKLFGSDTYYGKASEDSSGLLNTLNRMKSQQQSNAGLLGGTFGRYWELISHNAETPFEQLTPISPAAKLLHERNPIEAYKREQVYGTENAFWNKPWKNFIRPFKESVLESFGSTSIPQFIQDKRSLNEYFDVLKYVKAEKLSNEAAINGNIDLATEYEKQKSETLFGVNPYTYNYSSIFRALPQEDKAYYSAFAKAETMEERAEILNLVPENEKGLYIARWKQQYMLDIKKAEKEGLLTSEQLEEANKQEEAYRSDVQAEGLPSSKKLWYEYIKDRGPGESYGDWYRRTKLLSKFTLPGPDWVGWHPQVDLEDIKLKTVETMGEDMHDYGLWEDRARSLNNKPFINNDIVEPILEPDQLDESDRIARIDSLLRRAGVRATISTSPGYGNNTKMVFDHKRVSRDD